MVAVAFSSAEGIQMITAISPTLFVTSNDDFSLLLWSFDTQLVQVALLYFNSSFGVANSGIAFDIKQDKYLVVGHSNGYVTTWTTASNNSVQYLQSIDVRSSNPVNPWDLHNIRGLSLVNHVDKNFKYVITGSEDGNLCIIQIPTGNLLSCTVYNPNAKRGINSIALSSSQLLVANCAVGYEDSNLWYYFVDVDNWTISLKSKMKLVVNETKEQVFNFCVKWGFYSGGECFFASTEEGALWMGTVESDAITTLGYQILDINLGAALDFQDGKLVAAANNVYEFTTV